MRAASLALLIFITGCAHLGTPVPVQDAVVSDRLFCGLSIPDGGNVSEAQLAAFIDEVVEPRFPDGFTIWRAHGQWKGGDEEVMVLEIIHPLDAKLEDAVSAIADEYRRRFGQESVLRVTMPARMELRGTVPATQ